MSKIAACSLLSLLACIFGCSVQVSTAEVDPPPPTVRPPLPDTCSSTPAASAGWTGTSPAATSSDASLEVAFTLAEGRPLRTIAAAVRPAPGHTSLPERLPWFSLFDQGGVLDTVGTAFDASATLPAYEGEHEVVLDLSAFSWGAEPGHEQHARFVSEGGAGAVAGLRVLAWRCAY